MKISVKKGLIFGGVSIILIGAFLPIAPMIKAAVVICGVVLTGFGWIVVEE